jgi:hypothetical protein
MIVKPCMMHNYSKIESLFKILIMDCLNSFLDQLWLTFNIRASLFMFHLTVRYQIISCKSGLPSRRNKNDDWFSITEFFYVIVCWFIHCGHTGTIMLLTETLEMNLNRNRSYGWPKVKESVLIRPKPLSYISSVCHCCR